MFNQKTLIIIGAGAGFEIEMPMGADLSKTIAQKTEIKHQDNGEELRSGDPQIANVIRQLTAARGIDYNKWRAEACAISEGIQHSRSIDAYLNTHKDNEAIQIAGKLAIAQSILEAEDKCHLQRENGHWRDVVKVPASWFPELFYIMQDGVGSSDDISKIFTNVNFITFNYDRCLEQYLFHAIRDLYRTSEAKTSEIMEALEIHRPYGQVGLLDWQLKEGRKIAFGQKAYGELFELSQEIKTFNERVTDTALLNRMHSAINEATRLVFLGFHFHKQNMDLLQVSGPVAGSPPAPNPAAFLTLVDRSSAEHTMISARISVMPGPHRPTANIYPLGLGCKQLFKHYAATWM